MSNGQEFDPLQFLPYLLNQAAEKSSQSFQLTYKRKYGILRTEWRVLFHIALYHRITAKQICQKASLHKTKVSRAISKLEQRRYVQRHTNQLDQRTDWLSLTALGLSVYKDLCGHAGAYESSLQEKFSNEDLAVFRRILHNLISE